MRRSNLAFLLLPGLSLAAACADTREAVIESHLAPCTTIVRQMCKVVAEDGAQPAIFSDSIEGFTFRWGVEATVRYSVEELDDPPADGGSRRYRLEQTINEEFDDPGTTYQLTFPDEAVDDDWFAPDPAGAGAVQMSGTRVACDRAVCDQLLAGSQGAPLRVTFELTATPLTPLRAISVAR